ncbi:1-acyl-sn-glycerol-3-phosphate acyltransferase [Synechococcus sp. CCY 9618]|uniref:1-acyl-sn-glycerol-3-phosphate acyltransferase n=1 Tax=Synechococcus sp. CCY 9618 TaxID=2815602 RepID=UPI001C22ECD3|nr:1-acyl-sn-glycerol-3-phosphate acyltransferase [Synechococcus sp. CCY 9618]
MATAAPLGFLPPQLDGRVLAVSRWIVPLWLRWRSRITQVQVEGIDHLLKAFVRFQAGESRLLLAFRHPSLDDPACMARLLWVDLAREARRRGVLLDPAPHGQFLFDRGIPLWAGKAMGWLFTHLGGSSIQRGTLDLPALRTARQLLLEGPHPFALAPEGATNGHNERISPLEPGTAQLAFWTAADLAAAGRPECMELLPIGLQYTFIDSVWRPLEDLLSRLEAGAGLSPDASHDLAVAALHGRLVRLGECMLAQMEAFYRDRVHLPMPPLAPDAEAQEDRARFGARLQRLLDLALGRLEQSFRLVPRGSLSDRCRRLEQAGWERLYPDSADGPEAHSPLGRGLQERLAAEAEAQLWHMRVVESFLAVSGHYVAEHPSQERFADTLLLLWDTQCRIQGLSGNSRPRIGRRRVRIRIDRPIEVEGRLEDYRQDRRRAVQALTDTLGERLERLIVPSPLDGAVLDGEPPPDVTPRPDA